MSEIDDATQGEALEAPNWLGELEKKREIRLKRRLGHETGAGAPCLTCSTKCPGLDLHFWRKICKNCKCSKEAHDVHDDDIYGWAQFQLLGHKPNRIKTKITLPGKKDQVELEWTPQGQQETIDRYLKTLPPDLLPVKGSQAAQQRKQLLQKQIPIHDIDPGMCHELTDSELKQMHSYIEHMKQHSVGLGQVVDVSHPPVEYSHKLAERLGGMSVSSGQRELDEFFDKVPNPVNMNSFVGESEINRNLRGVGGAPPLPHFAPSKYDICSSEHAPALGSVRDLAYSTYSQGDVNSNGRRWDNNNSLNPLESLRPVTEERSPDAIHIGPIKDLYYPPQSINYPPQSINYPQDPTSDAVIPLPRPVAQCKKCAKQFAPDDFAILADRSNALYHSSCFKCAGCNQSLADMVYFYDKESDNIYCGRDYAKIRGIPRCRACDELIFVKEYCLAENDTFHLKHFCCFECDSALAGQNYVVEESQPLCLPCFEKLKANKCEGCLRTIKPDEQGVNLNGVHFHAECFACGICGKGLMGAKLLLRERRLYCSHDCYGRK